MSDLSFVTRLFTVTQLAVALKLLPVGGVRGIDEPRGDGLFLSETGERSGRETSVQIN